MGLGPTRPSTGSGTTTNKDPRLDEFLSEMPLNGLFVKNAQNQMQGIGVDASTIISLVNSNVPSMIASAEVEISRKADSSSLVMKADASSLVSKADSSSLVQYALKSSVDSLQSTISSKMDASSQIGLDRVTGLSNVLLAKLDASSNIESSKVSGLDQLLSGKVDGSSIVNINQAISNKADASSLANVSQSLTNKADASALSTFSQSLSNKVDVSGISAVGKSGNYNDLTNRPTIPTLNYPVTSVNAKTGVVILNAADVSAAAMLHTHQISDVSGLAAVIANKADSSGVAKVRYYTATSDTSSVWTVNIGTDFTEVYDVQVQPVSVANTIAGIRQCSLNSYTSSSKSFSGLTYGNNTITSLLITAGASTLQLVPATVVRLRVEGK